MMMMMMIQNKFEVGSSEILVCNRQTPSHFAVLSLTRPTCHGITKGTKGSFGGPWWYKFKQKVYFCKSYCLSGFEAYMCRPWYVHTVVFEKQSWIVRAIRHAYVMCIMCGYLLIRFISPTWQDLLNEHILSKLDTIRKQRTKILFEVPEQGPASVEMVSNCEEVDGAYFLNVFPLSRTWNIHE